MILQIIVSFFVGFLYLEILSEFKKKNLSLFNFAFWSLVWFAVLVVVWFPSLTSNLAHTLGIVRGMDAVVYLSIVVLFYLAFKILVKIEKTQRDISKIVRQNALSGSDDKNS